jgi:hypothetical protein
MRLLEIGMGCSMHSGVEGMHSLSVSICIHRFFSIIACHSMHSMHFGKQHFLTSSWETCAAVEEILDKHKGVLCGE